MLVKEVHDLEREDIADYIVYTLLHTQHWPVRCNNVDCKGIGATTCSRMVHLVTNLQINIQ